MVKFGIDENEITKLTGSSSVKSTIDGCGSFESFDLSEIKINLKLFIFFIYFGTASANGLQGRLPCYI